MSIDRIIWITCEICRRRYRGFQSEEYSLPHVCSGCSDMTPKQEK